MPKRESKKSENLEVRISYKAKQALYKKAQEEKRTVSAVIRSLIHTYLEPSKLTFTQASIIKFKQILQKPKLVFTSLMAALVGSLVFIPTATADDIMIDVEGKIVRESEHPVISKHTRTMKTSITMKEGATVFFELDAGQTPPAVMPATFDPKDVTGEYVMQVQVRAINSPSKQKKIEIQLSIMRKKDGVTTVLAEPILTTNLGKKAQFQIGTEGLDMIDFTFLPSIKT